MALMELRVITVDTFTLCRFGGNPAAVIPDCREIPPMYYPQIANEINLTQTAFVHKIADDHYMTQFYTPRKTLMFSGHAAIAAFFVLSTMGYIRPLEEGIKKATLQLDTGESLDIFITYLDYEVEKIHIKVPPVTLGVPKNPQMVTKENMAGYLKIPVESIERVETAGFFAKDILVFVKDKYHLDHIEPDFWQIAKLNMATDTCGVFTIYADTENPKPYAYARYCAPEMGIYEEAATGSAAAAAGKVIFDHTGKKEITIYQGQLLKRPSKIEVALNGDDIYLGGVARMVTDGIMHL